MAAQDTHWFGSSSVYWRVAETKAELTKLMDALDHYGGSYWIYKVPMALDAKYMIRNFEPVVEGVTFVEEVPSPRQARA